MQTYAAINVKMTAANMRGSLFMAFLPPCRKEGRFKRRLLSEILPSQGLEEMWGDSDEYDGGERKWDNSPG